MFLERIRAFVGIVGRNVYMIYGNTGLVYVNLDQDLLVAYSKSDIKEVNRERVHTGSHTSSNTVGVGAAHNRDQSSFINSVGVATDKTSSDTQELYEWHLDVMSDFLSIIAFSGIIAGASFASNLGWLSAQVLCCLIVGIVALIFYIRRKLKLNVPVLNMRVFKHRNFTLGAILVMIAFVGAVMLALVTTSSAIWYVILAHIILMIGAPLAMSPSQTSALNSLKGLESADGSAILNTMQQIVGALATALATSFLTIGKDAATGSAAFRFTNGVHYGMYFTIALTIISFIIALFVKDDGNYTD